MPYVGNKSTTFNTFSATDVSVTDDLTVTDDATIGGALSAKGGAVFNEDSADVDFRVESNGNANMLVVNGGTDRVGIGTDSPSVPFHVNTSSSGNYVAKFTSSNEYGINIKTSSDSDNHEQFTVINGQDSTVFKITGGGETTLKGDIIFATSGRGIVLGATSNTDANTLDDYEEGTWTPRLGGSSAGVTTPGTNNSGYYTKIGRVVHVTGFLVWSGTTTSISGDTQLQGLPFTVSNLVGNSPSQPITRQFNGFTNGSSLYQAFQAAPNTTVAVVNGYSAGGSNQNWTTSITASSSGNIYDINLTYITSA
mgnify:CR=1 FL=1